MQETIKKIVFNPCAYSMEDIRGMSDKGEVSREGILRVLGSEAVGRILELPEKDLPAGDVWEVGNGKMDDATQVVIWGIPDSGKTMVIASLLSLPGMQVTYPDAPSLRERIGRMIDLFAKEGELHPIPRDRGAQKEMYHAVYRKNWRGKAYPITFVEATIPTNIPVDVTTYARKDCSQIHVFCIDCRQDVQMQVRQLLSVTDGLKQLGYLAQTDGAYALVTKTDLMNVPEAFVDNAAQTLVTKGMPDLWRNIQDICYDNQIYNALPIPFSVGRFVLRDLAYLHAGDAETFLHEALLPKCQPRRGLIGKMLSIGRWWQAVIIGVLLACAIGWGGYKAFEMLTAPPTAPMLPYDYKTAFKEEEYGLAKMGYKEACQLYGQLRKDLEAESSLHTVTGENVLSEEDIRYCDSTLTNDFARVLNAKCNRLLESSHWSEDTETLHQLSSKLGDLLGHDDVLEDRDIRSYKNYIDDYFEYVRPLIKKSKVCKKIRDVDYVENNWLQWRKYPYTNDLDVRIGIRDAEQSAYESCARFYSEKVDSIIRLYPEDMSFSLSEFSYRDRNEEIREEKLEPYAHSVDSMMKRLNGKSDAFSTARKILRETEDAIYDF
ncbi:MAG: hypothetical protein IKH14_03940 [Prevotella sp.]|nr:hypothetical protein [Prevotella sp.]